jgi:hypothetical protein
MRMLIVGEERTSHKDPLIGPNILRLNYSLSSSTSGSDKLSDPTFYAQLHVKPKNIWVWYFVRPNMSGLNILSSLNGCKTDDLSRLSIKSQDSACFFCHDL